MVKSGEFASPVFTDIDPPRPPTHAFADTVKLTVPSVDPRASLVIVTKSPLFDPACHAQFALTAIDPVPPLTGKLCDLGFTPKLHDAASCVMITVFVATVNVPWR
jgi:hypothetical protein